MIRSFLKSLLKGPREAETLDSFSEGQSSEKEQLIKNLMRLHHLTVQDAMVPRSDITWIDATLPLEKILSKIKDFSHTRYPICQQELDSILGVIHIKNILLMKAVTPSSLKKHIEKILFVSPTMICLDLLIRMRREKKYMAVVVDEFGSVDGLITQERLIEKLGNQLDLSLETVAPLHYYDAASRSVIADGRWPIEECEKNFGVLLTEKERESDPETLAGLVLLLAGRIPNRGEVFKHSTGVIFEVQEVRSRGIKKIRLYNLGSLKRSKG